MTDRVHAKNWLKPRNTACNLAIEREGHPPRPIARTIRELTCDTCVLRILRTGQRLGLSEDTFGEWSLRDLERWQGEETAPVSPCCTTIARPIRTCPFYGTHVAAGLRLWCPACGRFFYGTDDEVEAARRRDKEKS